jgi:hypothetical protein
MPKISGRHQFWHVKREQCFAYRNFFCKGRGDETILGEGAKYTVIGERDMGAVKRNYQRIRRTKK